MGKQRIERGVWTHYRCHKCKRSFLATVRSSGKLCRRCRSDAMGQSLEWAMSTASIDAYMALASRRDSAPSWVKQQIDAQLAAMSTPPPGDDMGDEDQILRDIAALRASRAKGEQ